MCVGNQGTVGGSIRRTARTERRARRESRTATISGSVGCWTRRGRRGSEVQPSSQAAPLRTVPTTFTRNSARVDRVFVCLDSMCERDTPAVANTCSASTRDPGRSLIENSISTRAESIATRAGGSVGRLATAAPDESRMRAARSAAVPCSWLLLRPTARAQAAQARKGARESMLQMFGLKIRLVQLYFISRLHMHASCVTQPNFRESTQGAGHGTGTAVVFCTSGRTPLDCPLADAPRCWH